MSGPEELQIIRRAELAKLLRVSEMTIFRWEMSGHLPRKINVGPRVVGYRRVDIQDFLARRAAERPR